MAKQLTVFEQKLLIDELAALPEKRYISGIAHVASISSTCVFSMSVVEQDFLHLLPVSVFCYIGAHPAHDSFVTDHFGIIQKLATKQLQT